MSIDSNCFNCINNLFSSSTTIAILTLEKLLSLDVTAIFLISSWWRPSCILGKVENLFTSIFIEPISISMSIFFQIGITEYVYRFEMYVLDQKMCIYFNFWPLVAILDLKKTKICCMIMFVGSSSMPMPNLVQIGWTDSICHLEMWFFGSNWSILRKFGLKMARIGSKIVQFFFKKNHSHFYIYF